MNTSFKNYNYTILRYVHDTLTGEFINVGIALHAKKERYAAAKCQTKYARITNTFPGANGIKVKKILRNIEKNFNKLSERIDSELNLDNFESALDIALKVLPKDDSSLQWGETKTGRCFDLNDEVERLYRTFISKYDDRNEVHRKNDDDVWSNFKSNLETRNILHHFSTNKTISSDVNDVEFEHAWKNGNWHFIEPMSLDLSSAEYIKGKACKWLGQMTSIADCSENLKVYMLVAKPEDKSLINSFNQAKNLIKRSPVEVEIYTEEEAPSLIETLNSKISLHLES